MVNYLPNESPEAGYELYQLDTTYQRKRDNKTLQYPSVMGTECFIWS